MVRQQGEMREIMVRAYVVEDHGDDLVIQFTAPRGTTQCQVGRSEIIDPARVARATIVRSHVAIADDARRA